MFRPHLLDVRVPIGSSPLLSCATFRYPRILPIAHGAAIVPAWRRQTSTMAWRKPRAPRHELGAPAREWRGRRARHGPISALLLAAQPVRDARRAECERPSSFLRYKSRGLLHARVHTNSVLRRAHAGSRGRRRRSSTDRCPTSNELVSLDPCVELRLSVLSCAQRAPRDTLGGASSTHSWRTPPSSAPWLDAAGAQALSRRVFADRLQTRQPVCARPAPATQVTAAQCTPCAWACGPDCNRSARRTRRSQSSCRLA